MKVIVGAEECIISSEMNIYFSRSLTLQVDFIKALHITHGDLYHISYLDVI